MVLGFALSLRYIFHRKQIHYEIGGIDILREQQNKSEALEAQT
jgi:hypothetical protein